ncbi:MAG: hypothetical protein HY736_14280 [Verrucomicrobia bacterium]|nr:hypothetical protein [Verrucomicrobiota bacterium]
MALLKKPVLTPEETANASAVLALAGWLRERHAVSGEEKPSLQKLTLTHPLVRREFFWAGVRRRRPMGLHAIDLPLDIFSRYDELLEPAQPDVAWLVDDLDSLTDEADREVALRHACSGATTSVVPGVCASKSVVRLEAIHASSVSCENYIASAASGRSRGIISCSNMLTITAAAKGNGPMRGSWVTSTGGAPVIFSGKTKPNRPRRVPRRRNPLGGSSRPGEPEPPDREPADGT